LEHRRDQNQPGIFADTDFRFRANYSPRSTGDDDGDDDGAVGSGCAAAASSDEYSVRE
jgi:hypothetical protein